jgi:predicted transcriptional regulator
MKVELRLRFDAALAEELTRLAQKPGVSKAAILEDALRAFLDHGASRDLDERLRVRLEQMSSQLNRMERGLHILQEGFGLYLRFEFVATAAVADGDEAARAIGHQRYQSYLRELGRRLAHARSFRDSVLAQVQTEKDAS